MFQNAHIIQDSAESTCIVAMIQVDTKELTATEGVESVVGVWHRESPHNYENNSRINEEFVCSAANRFVIEFDSKCHTERR